MSLLVWLPLIKDTNNQGVADTTITTTGTITYSAGKLGNALTFNTSALTLKPAPITGSMSEFSFAFWYKPTDITNTHCIYNGRATVGGAVSIFRVSANTFRFDDGAQHTFTYKTVKDTWQHIVFTRDNTNIKLYVNGVLNQTMTSSSFTSAGSTASIGMSSTSGTTPSGNSIAGQINDYRIYDHVLSVKEIKELAKGLCLHLPLDWGGNENILPYTPVTSNSSEYNTELGRTVWVRSTTATGESYIYGSRTDIVEQSAKYTFSAWIWVNEYVKSVDFYWLSTNITNKKTGATWDNVTSVTGQTPTPSTWNYMTWTFTTKADDYTGFIRVDNNGSSTSGTAAILKVANMKLEKGEKATPYIPHKNDTTYSAVSYGDKFIQDCSGYNRAVTKTGTGMSISSDSPRGTGTNWNGGGKIYVTGGFPVGTTTIFTINAWVRTTADKTQTRYNDVFGFYSKNNAGNTTYTRCELESTAGTNLKWFGAIADASGFCDYSMTTGTWAMITLVSDGSTLKSYKDGVLLTTFTPTSSYNAWQSTGDLIIGDQNAGTGYYDIADFRVYATALSADDIKELYQIPAQIDKSGNVYCSNFVEE